MSNYRRGRSGRQGKGNVATKGMFVNGVWNCDCSPRLSAVRLQVKKENMNKGRWFYKCQKQQDGQCNFFLWDDDAKPREEHTLLNNLRSRPLHANQATPSKPQNSPEPPPPYTPSTSPEQLRKRPRNIVEENDEFAFCHGDDEGFTQELDQVMAAAETPRKVARTESFTTPTRRKLPWTQYNQASQGLQTPQTEHRAVADPLQTRFVTPKSSFFTPTKYKEPEGNTHQAIMPTSSLPTPSRCKDMKAKDDLVQEVFNLLHDSNVTLSSQAETELKSVLSRYTRKSEAFRKAQELVKLSLKTKEARISELEYRISLLENEKGDHSDY